jgi:hypothetical protein
MGKAYGKGDVEGVFPLDPKGGGGLATISCGEEVGAQLGRLDIKPGTLYTLWG